MFIDPHSITHAQIEQRAANLLLTGAEGTTHVHIIGSRVGVPIKSFKVIELGRRTGAGHFISGNKSCSARLSGAIFDHLTHF
jgi:hypothetical protein